jgi:hypothetical protein
VDVPAVGTPVQAPLGLLKDICGLKETGSKTAGITFDDICEWMSLIAGMDIQKRSQPAQRFPAVNLTP